MIECTFETFQEMIFANKEHDLYVFGKSLILEDFLSKYPNFKIAGIIDNNSALRGNFVDFENYKSLQIFSLEDLSDKNVIILITSKHIPAISIQCETEGFKRVYSYLNLLDLSDKLPKVKALLCDNKSNMILDKIMQKHAEGISDYTDIYEDKQYFVQNIINLGTDEIFLDCGAYNGDTVEAFLKVTNHKFNKIYSFEPIFENFIQLQKKYEQDANIICINKGISDKEEQRTFLIGGSGSRMVENEENTKNCVEVNVMSIDSLHLENVTFIKMDIEGCELEGLKGALNTIQKYKPKLAICLYHKFSDIFEIPMWIAQLDLGYQFYIRHHSKIFWETVLYAI